MMNVQKDDKKKKTNQIQFDRLVELMNTKPDIARNFSSRPPEETNAFWEKVTETLNSLGPPVRDTNGWKKVWSDFKAYIKRKLVANMKENTSTGGGPYKQKSFNDIEENVIALMNLRSSITGIGAKSFGNRNADAITPPVAASTSDSVAAPPESTTVNDENNTEESKSTPRCSGRQRKPRRPLTSIQLLSKQIRIQEGTSRAIKEMAANIKKVNKNLQGLKEISKDKLREMQKHNKTMEELRKQELEIKSKQMELEIRRLEIMLQD